MPCADPDLLHAAREPVQAEGSYIHGRQVAEICVENAPPIAYYSVKLVKPVGTTTQKLWLSRK